MRVPECVNVFAATRSLLAERGFAARPSPQGRRSDPLPIHGALREACGLSPVAWLPAYRDWETTTAVFQRAYELLRDLVCEHAGGLVEPSVWAAREGEAALLALLDVAEERHPELMIDVDHPPRLRRGCKANVAGTLSISGVLIAALKQLCEARPDQSIGAVVGEVAERTGIDLRTVENEEFLHHILRADPSGGEGTGKHVLTPSATAAFAALQRTAQVRTDYRLPHLLGALARCEALPLEELDDDRLAEACRKAADPEDGDRYLFPRFGTPRGLAAVLPGDDE